MILRGAGTRDIKAIKAMFVDYDFTLDYKHIESLVVIEKDNAIIAVASLVRMLEGSFLVDKNISKKDKIRALKMIMRQVDIEIKNLGYENYTVFGTKSSLNTILKRHFAFVTCKGEALISWLKG